MAVGLRWDFINIHPFIAASEQWRLNGPKRFIFLVAEQNESELRRKSNPWPLASKARIIALDHWASHVNVTSGDHTHTYNVFYEYTRPSSCEKFFMTSYQWHPFCSCTSENLPILLWSMHLLKAGVQAFMTKNAMPPVEFARVPRTRFEQMEDA